MIDISSAITVGVNDIKIIRNRALGRGRCLNYYLCTFWLHNLRRLSSVEYSVQYIQMFILLGKLRKRDSLYNVWCHPKARVCDIKSYIGNLIFGVCSLLTPRQWSAFGLNAIFYWRWSPNVAEMYRNNNLTNWPRPNGPVSNDFNNLFISPSDVKPILLPLLLAKLLYSTKNVWCEHFTIPHHKRPFTGVSWQARDVKCSGTEALHAINHSLHSMWECTPCRPPLAVNERYLNKLI